MAHRRRVQESIARRNRIDLGGISVARSREHPVREHGALGPAGGPGRVEQPGEIVALAWPRADRIGGEQGLVLGAADGDEALESRRRVRADLAVESVRGEADASAGVFQDIGELAAVQLGVRRHRGQSRVPDAEHQFEIIRRIFRDDGDALTGLKAEALPQRGGEPSHAAGDFRVIPDDARAQAQRRPVPVTQSYAFEPQREVHGGYAAAALPLGCTSAV
jgi:hypothetical protein